MNSLSNLSWPEAMVVVALIIAAIFLIGGAYAGWLDTRKTKVLAGQEEELRQLVQRYERLSENTLDVQQRVAADLSELRSRTSSVEQILRTVE